LPSKDISVWVENLKRKEEPGEVAREDEKRDV